MYEILNILKWNISPCISGRKRHGIRQIQTRKAVSAAIRSPVPMQSQSRNSSKETKQ